MRSKVVAAEMARSGGVAVVIADGRTPDVVTDASAGRPVGTRFSADPSPLSAYKLWVRYGKPVRGRVEVDAGADRAVSTKGTSLLAVGVTAVDGAFAAGDAIELTGPDGKAVAVGIASRSAGDVRAAIGIRGAGEVVHRDNLVVRMNAIAPNLTADARAAARAMASVDSARRDAALEAIAQAIEQRATEIQAANELDVAAATGHQTAAIIDRLTLTPDRIAGLAEGVRAVIALPDPIGTVLSRIERDNGLVIEKVRVPLGVVAVIYEARPNVTTDAAALTLKSGNACILRGSRMAANTNRVLIDLVRSAIEASGLPIDSVQEMEADRERLREFIAQPGAADVVIPRGGEELKHFLLDNSRIPVLAAAGGNNHVYVDATADAAMAEAIAVNSKIQRPGVCNSAETLLVHRDRPELMESITAALRDRGRRDRRGRRGLGRSSFSI